jgi:P-type Cu2+ transporter
MSTASPSPAKARTILNTGDEPLTIGPECDLCGLGCGKRPLSHYLGAKDCYFCCAGCMNVYAILLESGVAASGQDFQQTDLFKRSLEMGLISQGEGLRKFGRETSEKTIPPDTPVNELLLQISGMWCSSCAWLIEHSLATLPGVVSAEAFFAADLVKVKYCPQVLPPDHVVQRISSLGYRTQEYRADNQFADDEKRDLLLRFGLAAFFWLNIMTLSTTLYVGYFEQISSSARHFLPFVLMALATPVIFYCAQPVLRLAWNGLIHRTIRMELLLGLGILAAYGYSSVQVFRGEGHVYFDTASVIVTLVLAGKLIEKGAKEKVSRWITQLHRMLPNKIRLLAGGVERFVSIEALEPGEIFVVKAGERIPADGVIVEGDSHADESLLTGESVPVAKNAGSNVAAGSVNMDGVLHVRARCRANDSTLQRIVRSVEQALSSRSTIERTVDRVSRVFVPAVVLIALATFGLCWITGLADVGESLMRAITVLVIACPCALGMATPLAITAAMGSASRQGILVSDGRVLETLRKVNIVILDKTGTVTDGRFSLLNMEMCDKETMAPVLVSTLADDLAPNVPGAFVVRESSARQCRELALNYVASLEQYSEHPLGKVVVRSALEEGVPLLEADTVRVLKGEGITGCVDGLDVFVGNRRLASRVGASIDPQSERRAKEWEEQCKTVTFFGWDGRLQGLLALGDKVRADAHDVVAELQRRDIEVHVISGDSLVTTKWIASRVGADHAQAEVTPEGKADIVRKFQSQGLVVAMVGDGINDAPALAQADLGIAMGSGADIAMEAAAVVLVSGSLRKIVDVFDLSRKTMRVVRQNLFWAFFYNTLGIGLAVTGVLNPLIAALAMLMSSLSVIANSLRITRTITA